MVTDIKYNNGEKGGTVSFKVGQATIRQGNAVIAVKNAQNEVLWSWHIWVTDEKIDETIEITNSKDKRYNIMPVDLGWCDGYQTSYAERSCKVRFIAGGKTKEFVITQSSHADWTCGNSPLYEWGRKDPFQPSSGNDNTTKTWYTADGTPSNKDPKTKEFSTEYYFLYESILKPNVKNTNVAGSCYYNVWSAKMTRYNDNKSVVVKTVYDPCPVGFKVPAGDTFTGFTTTNGNEAKKEQINGTWDSFKKGWHFYTNSTKDKTIFFPASSGTRHGSGNGLMRGGEAGYSWTATPVSGVDGKSLRYMKSEVYPMRNMGYLWAVAVRPSHE